MEKFDVQSFDRFLSEPSVKPEWILMHPRIWNGYYNIYPIPKIIRRIFWKLGRIFRNKYFGWVGLPLHWETGMKEYFPENLNIYWEIHTMK